MVGDKKYVLDRVYSNVSKNFLKNYIDDLNKLIDTLKKTNCESESCNFDSDSKLFQTICNEVNSDNSSGLELDKSLKNFG